MFVSVILFPRSSYTVSKITFPPHTSSSSFSSFSFSFISSSFKHTFLFLFVSHHVPLVTVFVLPGLSSISLRSVYTFLIFSTPVLFHFLLVRMSKFSVFSFIPQISICLVSSCCVCTKCQEEDLASRVVSSIVWLFLATGRGFGMQGWEFNPLSIRIRLLFLFAFSVLHFVSYTAQACSLTAIFLLLRIIFHLKCMLHFSWLLIYFTFFPTLTVLTVANLSFLSQTSSSCFPFFFFVSLNLSTYFSSSFLVHVIFFCVFLFVFMLHSLTHFKNLYTRFPSTHFLFLLLQSFVIICLFYFVSILIFFLPFKNF